MTNLAIMPFWFSIFLKEAPANEAFRSKHSIKTALRNYCNIHKHKLYSQNVAIRKEEDICFPAMRKYNDELQCHRKQFFYTITNAPI